MDEECIKLFDAIEGGSDSRIARESSLKARLMNLD